VCTENVVRFDLLIESLNVGREIRGRVQFTNSDRLFFLQLLQTVARSADPVYPLLEARWMTISP
jgi:hypothetical protein